MIPSLASALVAVSRSFELAILVKATAILVFGLAAAQIVRRARASIRHLTLAATFAAVIALPLVTVGGPAVAIRIPLERVAIGAHGSPLIAAATVGALNVVSLLLDRGALIDQVVPGDENALIQASGSGHLEVVKLLVARGADVNARVWAQQGSRPQNGEWWTPLSMARRGRNPALVEFLVSAGARE